MFGIQTNSWHLLLIIVTVKELKIEAGYVSWTVGGVVMKK